MLCDVPRFHVTCFLALQLLKLLNNCYVLVKYVLCKQCGIRQKYMCDTCGAKAPSAHSVEHDVAISVNVGSHLASDVTVEPSSSSLIHERVWGRQSAAQE